jgi:hypothetical protein
MPPGNISSNPYPGFPAGKRVKIHLQPAGVPIRTEEIKLFDEGAFRALGGFRESLGRRGGQQLAELLADQRVPRQLGCRAIGPQNDPVAIENQDCVRDGVDGFFKRELCFRGGVRCLRTQNRLLSWFDCATRPLYPNPEAYPVMLALIPSL